MGKRIVFEIDVTYTDTYGHVDTNDLLKLFTSKSGTVKNISIKKTNKRKEEGK